MTLKPRGLGRWRLFAFAGAAALALGCNRRWRWLWCRLDGCFRGLGYALARFDGSAVRAAVPDDLLAQVRGDECLMDALPKADLGKGGEGAAKGNAVKL